MTGSPAICAQVAALPPQRSSTAPQLRPGQRSPGGGAESLGQPAFRVTDYAPDWDSTSGGAKLLLTGSLLAGAPPRRAARPAVPAVRPDRGARAPEGAHGQEAYAAALHTFCPTVTKSVQNPHVCSTDWHCCRRQVPATVLQPGVLRARVPPHAPGPVRVAVSLGDGVPRSRPLAFEYRVPATPQLSEDDRCVCPRMRWRSMSAV